MKGNFAVSFPQNIRFNANITIRQIGLFKTHNFPEADVAKCFPLLILLDGNQ